MISTKISLILILVIFWSGSVPAQENNLKQSSSQPHKITLYGNLGNFYLYATLSLNIEAKIWQRKKKLEKSIWIKAGASWWVSYLSYEAGGPSFLLGGVYMTGKSDHFFEAMLGATYIYNRITYNAMLSEYEGERYYNPDISEPQKSEYIQILPAGSVGYRYQPSNRQFLFRAGVGFPDAFYFSLGFSI